MTCFSQNRYISPLENTSILRTFFALQELLCFFSPKVQKIIMIEEYAMSNLGFWSILLDGMLSQTKVESELVYSTTTTTTTSTTPNKQFVYAILLHPHVTLKKLKSDWSFKPHHWSADFQHTRFLCLIFFFFNILFVVKESDHSPEISPFLSIHRLMLFEHVIIATAGQKVKI